jgi:lipopolysaccharide heptosyltransferase I
VADEQKFLIVRLGSLGDVIHAIPAAAALRARHPQARIDWLVDPRYEELLGFVEAIDGVIAIDPRWLRRGGERPEFMARMREVRATGYDAVIDLQGLVKSAALARACGGSRTIGFPRQHLREPLASMMYTETPHPGSATHVVHKNIALLRAVGVYDRTVHFPIRVPRTPVVEAVVAEYAATGYALVNPGAAWPNKRWPPARFGAVAAAVKGVHGLPSLVLWGPGEEAAAREVVEASQGAAELAPATTLPDLMGLARHARLMVSGDTGPLHIAGAMGAPIVALFGPTDPERNGPWMREDVSISRAHECECLYERRCRRVNRCIDDIGVDEVVEGIRRRLATHA